MREFDPKTGLYVFSVPVGDVRHLYVAAWAENVELESREILVAAAADPVASGRQQRLQLVAESVARYLTTGGTAAELRKLIVEFELLNFRIADDGPWTYLSSVPGESGWRHVYADLDTQEALLWQEAQTTEQGSLVGGFVERTTLEKIADGLREEPDSEEDGDD